MSGLTRALRDEIRVLNEHPLNQAALEWLPDDWSDGSTLHLLALALWGVHEGIEPPCYGVDLEMIEAEIMRMANRVERGRGAHVIHQIEYLESGDRVLTGERLEQAESREHAVCLLFEEIARAY